MGKELIGKARNKGLKAHCLFEQSGTFKNEFKKLGIEAYDYDILNDYGQTDFQIDLYSQIRGGITESRVFLMISRAMMCCLRFFRVFGLKIKYC